MRNSMLAIALLLSPAAVHADEASHRAAAEELLVSMNLDQMMDSYTDAMRQGMMQGFRQAGGGPENEAIFEKYADQMAALMRETMSWERMKDPMIDLYVDVFTEDEIGQIATFYKSPVGAKTITEMPRMMQAGAEIGKSFLTEIMPRIQQINQEMVSELREAKPQP